MQYTPNILGVILKVVDVSRQESLVWYMPAASILYDEMCCLTKVLVGGRFPSSYVTSWYSSFLTFRSYQIAYRNTLYQCYEPGMLLFVRCKSMCRAAVCVGGTLLATVLSMEGMMSQIVDATR